MASNLSTEQQAAFDAVKGKIGQLKEEIRNSLNLQANGGYHVLNELINMDRLLTKVEEAPAGTAPTPEGGGTGA